MATSERFVVDQKASISLGLLSRYIDSEPDDSKPSQVPMQFIFQQLRGLHFRKKFYPSQNLLLAMTGWPLMIYKIPLSWVESVVAYLNGCLRKWLVLVETCQMYLFTVMKHHVHCQCMVQKQNSRSVGLEDCYNPNSQKTSQLETTSQICIQMESEKLQSKEIIIMSKGYG